MKNTKTDLNDSITTFDSKMKKEILFLGILTISIIIGVIVTFIYYNFSVRDSNLRLQTTEKESPVTIDTIIGSKKLNTGDIVFFHDKRGDKRSGHVGIVLDSKDSISTILRSSGNSKLAQNPIKISDERTLIYVDSSKTYKGLDKRIGVLEKALLTSPEKTLEIYSLKNDIISLQNDIKHIEELEVIRVDSLNTRLDLLNSWILGLLITILSITIGLFLNWIKKKNEINKTVE